MSALARVAALLRAELRRILRQEDLYLSLLLPALFYAPMVFGVAVLTSDPDDPTLDRVALTAELEAELALAPELDRVGLEAWLVDDPRAAFEEGQAGAAVVSWTRGSGLAGVRVEPGVGDDWAWHVAVVAQDQSHEDDLRLALRSAGDAWLRSSVSVMGVDPDRVWPPVIAVLAWRPPPSVGQGDLVFLLMLVAGLVGFQLLAVAGTTDRAEGITETLLATSTTPAELLAARLLATLGIEATLLFILWFNTGALLATLGELPTPGPGAVLALVTGAALQNVAMAWLGAWSPSLRTTGNLLIVPVAGSMGALWLGRQLGLPCWVPLAGLGTARTDADLMFTALGQLALVGVAMGFAAAWSRRHTWRLVGDTR